MDKKGRKEEVRNKAEQGKVEAQFLLGLSYDLGMNVTQNYEEAVVWYRRAAV